MNWKAFWVIFGLAQVVGAIGVLTGSSHGNPTGLLFALVFLFPGSVFCLLILETLGIGTTVGPIMVTSFLINVACWFAVALNVGRLRGKRSS
jgi:hypothetical protein